MPDRATPFCQNAAPGACECVIACTAPAQKVAESNPVTDFSGFVGPLVWPAVILVLALVFRRHLVSILERVLPRVSKLSIGGFSIELAKVKEATIEYADPNMDYRHSGKFTDVFDSTARMFEEQLSVSDEADYAIVDLGDGTEWLDSRLFIIAALLRRMRGIRVFVFLESAPGVRRKYLGTANSDKIRWRLAMLCPWLEDAFQKASVFTGQITSTAGAMEPHNAKSLLSNYLGLIQQPGQGFLQFIPEPFEIDAGIRISGGDSTPEAREHAKWIDGARLEKILGPDLGTSSVRRSELKGLSGSDQQKLLLAEPDPFIAVTRDDGRFEYLVERTKVMDTVVSAYQAGES